MPLGLDFLVESAGTITQSFSGAVHCAVVLKEPEARLARNNRLIRHI